MSTIHRLLHDRLKKLGDDVARLKQYARFVITLTESGEVGMVDNGHLFRENAPYAPLIAIVGPAEYKDNKLQETVLLEIGYFRTRPYRRIEVIVNGKTMTIPLRHRVRELTDSESQKVYPLLLDCMTQIVLERRSIWKSKEEWYLKGCGYVERGVHFTFSRKDRWLCRQVFLEHLRFLEDRYMSKHARWLSWRLRGLKFLSYTPAQLRSYKNADLAYRVISGPGYASPLRLEAFLSLASRQHRNTRQLMERILLAFGMEVNVWDEDTELVFSSFPSCFPAMEKTRCYIGSAPRTFQAKDCVVAEIVLEKGFRTKLEKPSTSQSYLPSTQAGVVNDQGFQDCPF